MLSEEDANKIKQQIIKQIDSWHANEQQKQQAKKQILEMPIKELEQFLIKNKLIKTQEQKTTSTEGKAKEQCPFCLITQDKIPTYKIDENKESIAVLEINPLSKAHTLIIPKTHKNIDNLPSSAFDLAKKIARKIKSKLKPKSVSIQTAEIFNHAAVNVIPVYEGKMGERKKASEEELKQLQEKLTAKKPIIIKETKKARKKLPKAPIRIP